MKKLLSMLLLVVLVMMLAACQPDESGATPSQGDPAPQNPAEGDSSELTLLDTGSIGFVLTTYIEQGGEEVPSAGVRFSAEGFVWDGHSFTYFSDDEEETLEISGKFSDDFSMIEDFNFTYERDGSMYLFDKLEIVNVPAIEQIYDTSFPFGFRKDLDEALEHINVWEFGDIGEEFNIGTEERLSGLRRFTTSIEIEIYFRETLEWSS